jgi:NAD(P)H-dependent FMN reductase
MSTKNKHKILIVTHSSPNGLNQRQVMECANVIGFTNHDLNIQLDPTTVDREAIESADKIIMVVPEWNSSFPWTFKKMIDDSGYPSAFEGKPVFLVGTSHTTFGNIVGLNHLAHILDWLGAPTLEKVCIPFIQEKFANDDIKVDERLNEALIGFANC